MKLSILKGFGILVVLVVIAWSCQQEETVRTLPPTEELQAQSNSVAQSNSQIVATTQDIADITSGAFEGKGLTGGRKISSAPARGLHNGCDPVITADFSVYKGPDSVAIQGHLVIDYGDGSSCPDSTDVMKGKILDSFVLLLSRHDSVSFSLTDSITFDNFQKDSIQLAGLFVKHSTQWQTCTINIQDARITYGDGTFVTWSGSLPSVLGTITVTSQNDDANSDEHDDGEMDDDQDNNVNDTISNPNEGDHWSFGRTVTGSISGSTREGAPFTAEITNPIVYDFSCSRKVPVSGTITLTVGGVESTIDYGNGSCNRKYTIDAGGETMDYHFENHHWH